jgi:hypothetical protein
MEALSILLIIVIAVIVFDVLAVMFGADSRESFGDDHAR